MVFVKLIAAQDSLDFYYKGVQQLCLVLMAKISPPFL